jgi:hypothetical protein
MTFDKWFAKNKRKMYDWLNVDGYFEPLFKEVWQAAQPKWQPIETAPKTFDPVLLLYYENKKPVIVIAHWVAEFSEESTEDFAVYNEETDEYYCPEGWYEQQRFNEEYGYILMDIEPRYWMPLPQPPTDE